MEFTRQLNSINILNIEIVPAFENSLFSVLAYDNEGGIWREKFATTEYQAKRVAVNMVKSIKKLY